MTSTFEFLLGTWDVQRTIWDHRAATTGTFTGQAALRPEGAGRAVFEESGTMAYGGHAGPARRQLRYVDQPDGTVEVRFPDGHLFVVLDLRRPAWTGTHPCRADRYELAVTVVDADTVEERWNVRGPEKDYDALAVLTRVAA